MKKKCKIVMLPTDEKAYSSLVLDKTNTLRVLVGPIKKNPAFTPQHLYILSPDEESIKEGDYVYHEQMFNHIGFTGIAIAKERLSNQDFRFESILDNSQYYLSTKSPKVIATTNSSLNLPLIPTIYLKEYIVSYNAGNIPTEVEVEYEDNGHEDWIGDGFNGEPFWNERIEPWINRKDNTISIKPIKDSWTREEVKKLICSIVNDINRLYGNNLYDELDTINWINQNL